MSVGSTVTGALEIVGDHDWFKISLTAGQAVTITLSGITLEDPYLRIRDSAGNIVYQNDDISPSTNRDSKVSFSAAYSGTYYIDVGAWNDGYAGDYQLSVTNYTPPPPLWTNDQIADQLASGYWGGTSHHFHVGSGRSITVNLTALTPDGQKLAREALALWSDIIGVTFTEVTTGGQITFDDNQDGASADARWGTDGITTSAHVNVSTQWLADYGTSFDSYAFQTYIHEIGHALGLGHSGNYNGDARYPYEAMLENDAWSTSVMSYFDQRENSYFAGQGFTREFIGTPMVADILGVAQLYGLSTSTRTGDTTYGFNSNAGRAVYNASLYPSVAYAVFDNGGRDTLDYSGFSAAQRIDLTPESFSNVGGGVGNVTIARGTIIENVIGGSGADTIIGNGAANVLQGRAGADALEGRNGSDTLTGGAQVDRLTGGSGNDIFRDTAAGLNGDTIVDFGGGDRILITDANASTFSFSLSGSTLTYSGGSLTLSAPVAGTIVANAASGGGVALTIQAAAAADARNDFNGDGRSDVLWRSDSGALSNWLGQSNGGFANNDANAFANVSTDWKIAGTGDFNGDGRDDILWRSDSGVISNWLGTAAGGFANNDANAYTGVPTSWKVAGVGDFNGDGRDDILWRSISGELSNWLGTASGGFSTNDANAYTVVSTAWTVAGVGDFNGDGRDDILWRSNSGELSNWLGQANGGFASNDANAFAAVSTDWKVIGTGDFNGDGRDDILWRHESGTLSNWLGTASGGFAGNDANALAGVSLDWHVAGIGDFNGDGRDDILWRSDAGTFSNWLGTAAGGFANNDANALTQVATNWHVESPDTLFL